MTSRMRLMKKELLLRKTSGIPCCEEALDTSPIFLFLLKNLHDCECKINKCYDECCGIDVDVYEEHENFNILIGLFFVYLWSLVEKFLRHCFSDLLEFCQYAVNKSLLNSIRGRAFVYDKNFRRQWNKIFGFSLKNVINEKSVDFVRVLNNSFKHRRGVWQIIPAHLQPDNISFLDKKYIYELLRNLKTGSAKVDKFFLDIDGLKLCTM